MKKESTIYRAYVAILREELIPAMGCTEPIAVAYAAAEARRVLGALPSRVLVEASGSIIKNVKSVIVPHTNHLKGVPAAAAAGIVAGRPEKQLEVIADVSDDAVEEMNAFLAHSEIHTRLLDSGHEFDILVTERTDDGHVSRVRITDYHTNIVLIEKDGKALYQKATETASTEKETRTDRKLLNMEEIWDFATTCDLADVRDVLERQIRYNTAISEEGLRGEYGANIGRVLLKTYGDDLQTRARAKAAAGSDARMNGCELPVVINSGSGNQGITCSVPVIEYAKDLHADPDTLLRALVLSNLVAIHQKTGIGTLSAYCGAVSAGAGAGAGIAYLCGDGYRGVIHTVVNALAIVSGIICDGAKPSCAAKIAASVDAAILGHNMYRCGQEFKGGDGIVVKGIEGTIRNIGRLGKEGMRETNREIIRMMTEEPDGPA